MVNNFAKGCAIKFLLELALKRSFSKIFKQSMKDILRFGITTGSTATVFHGVLCILRRIGKKKGLRYALDISRRMAIIIASLFSSLPLLYGLQDNELNLLKLIFYPLAFRCVFDKAVELGWVTPFKHGDIIAYVCFNVWVAFTYTQERQSCPPSLYKMIEIYSQMKVPEFRMYSTMKTAWRAQIAQKYFPHLH